MIGDEHLDLVLLDVGNAVRLSDPVGVLRARWSCRVLRRARERLLADVDDADRHRFNNDTIGVLNAALDACEAEPVDQSAEGDADCFRRLVLSLGHRPAAYGLEDEG